MLRTPSASIQAEAEIDSSTDCTMVSRSLAAELGANIQPLIGQVHMADQSTVPREGEFTCVLMTAKHVFALRTEVFPGKTNPPVLIGHDIIKQCGIGELPSPLASRDDHPLATTNALDLPADELGDDLVNREQILKAVIAVAEKNAAMDLTKPCPYPEAVENIDEMLSLGFIKPVPQGSGAHFFTTLDITKVYHHPPIAKLDRPKTAFMWAWEQVINYVREYLPHLHHLTLVLDKLHGSQCNGRKKIELDTEQVKVFNDLWKEVAASIKLYHPQSDFPFFVATDASDTGIGTVLY
ncbi:DNA/RNA polymerase [Coemansia reversa NRRL 1564]|uniref:DNA/RNA polymerase n=1 Tax=Coemansia reversa (strain ATCC 12441 / NRRL 1564) TaxID=763665 RepID=A0A2G5B3I5_COERN|nr:DNA/RNA polymerase [Coemansia reversa NRRL 1564]|eukprot:PIA13579.1 DNA/RNA polymerase [Coemansia reversa NRRL 1564]